MFKKYILVTLIAVFSLVGITFANAQFGIIGDTFKSGFYDMKINEDGTIELKSQEKVGGRVGAGSNSFPNSLNNFNEGDILSEDVINSIEAKIGIDGSSVTSTLDYLIKSSSSTDPGHLHSSSGISGVLDFSDQTNATAGQGITFNDDEIVAQTIAGGSDTQLQYNNGGSALGGATGFTYTSSTQTVGLPTSTFSNYLDISPISAPGHTEGRLYYDSSDDSLVYYNNDSDVSLNIGREEWIRVRNETGSTINNGEVVRIDGAHPGNDSPTVVLAQANNEENAEVAGVATHDIENNSSGYISVAGLVRDLNTSAFSAGDKLWLSASTPGAFTNTMPQAPNFAVSVGHVTQASAGNGTINVLLGEGRSAVYTDGSVPFASSSGALVEDNTNFFWDSTNKRLGIGTTTPSSALDIIGNLEVSGTSTVGTVESGTWQATDIGISHGGTGASDATTARSNLGLSIGSDVQAWDSKLDDISGLSVTTGTLVAGSGSGTFGTFDPSPAEDGQCMIASSTAPTGWEFVSCPTGPTAGSPQGDSGEVQYNNGGNFGGMNNVFWNDTSELLGIGTTTPLSKLHVVGSSTFTGDLLPETDNTYDIGSASKRWANIYAATTTIGNSITIGSNSINGSGTTTISTDSGNLTINPNGSVSIKGNYTLPDNDGTNTQVIETDGSGNLSFTDPANAFFNSAEIASSTSSSSLSFSEEKTINLMVDPAGTTLTNWYLTVKKDGATFTTSTSQFWNNVKATSSLTFEKTLNFDGANFIYDNESKSVSFPDNVFGVYVKPDGTEAWGIDFDGNVQGYDLSTPYDISTASGNGNNTTLGNTHGGLSFKPDGTKMYRGTWSSGGDEQVAQYVLTTPWDVSTASSTGNFNPGIGNDLNYFSIGDDGSKLYITHSSEIREYTLSTPWDVTSASFVQANTDFGESDRVVVGHNPTNSTTTDDTYLHRNSAGELQKLEFSTPWDISTATTTKGTFTNLQATASRGNSGDLIKVSDDEFRFYNSSSNAFYGYENIVSGKQVITTINN